jgi:hypothetical protein
MCVCHTHIQAYTNTYTHTHTHTYTYTHICTQPHTHTFTHTHTAQRGATFSLYNDLYYNFIYDYIFFNYAPKITQVSSDAEREETQLKDATSRQESMDMRVQDEMSQALAKVHHFKLLYESQIQALGLQLGIDDKKDRSRISMDDKRQSQQRHSDTLLLQQQVQEEMKTLEHAKEQLSVEIEGIMAVSRSEDAGLRTNLDDLKDTATRLESEADVDKATAVAQEINQKASIEKLENKVQESKKFFTSKLHKFRSSVDHSARQRADLETKLQGQMRQVALNVTLQESKVRDMLTKLQNTNDILQQRLRADVADRAQATDASLSHLNAKVIALQENAHEWASSAQSKQEAAQTLDTSNERRLARLDQVLRSNSEATEREMEKVKRQDDALLQTLEAKALNAEQNAHATNASLLTEIHGAEDRIESRLDRERQWMLARISAAQSAGEVSRKQLQGQLNATLAATGNLLTAYQAMAAYGNAREQLFVYKTSRAKKQKSEFNTIGPTKEQEGAWRKARGASIGGGGGRDGRANAYEEEGKKEEEEAEAVAKRLAMAAATGKEEEEEEQKAEAMRAEMRETVICFIFAST